MKPGPFDILDTETAKYVGFYWEQREKAWDGKGVPKHPHWRRIATGDTMPEVWTKLREQARMWKLPWRKTHWCIAHETITTVIVGPIADIEDVRPVLVNDLDSIWPKVQK